MMARLTRYGNKQLKIVTYESAQQDIKTNTISPYADKQT